MTSFFSFQRVFAAPLLAFLFMPGGGIAQADGVYKFSEAKQAEQRAQEQGLGVAWVCSTTQMLNKKDTIKGSSDDLTQMVMTSLRRGDDSCVVIFVDGKSDLVNCPTPVYDAMVHRDEVSFRTHEPWFYIPKIVFTNADASFVLGKVTYTQMYHDRENPLIGMLFHVAREIHKSQFDAAPPITPPPSPAPGETTASNSDDGVSLSMSDDPGSQAQAQGSATTGTDIAATARNYAPIAIIILAVSVGSGLLIYQLFSWSRPQTETNSGTSYEPPTPRFPPIPAPKTPPPRQTDQDFRPR